MFAQLRQNMVGGDVVRPQFMHLVLELFLGHAMNTGVRRYAAHLLEGGRQNHQVAIAVELRFSGKI
jgi:hypothetical protein